MKKTKLSKILSIFLCGLLLLQQSGFAQVASQLDISGKLASFGNSITVERFRPLHLRYLQYNPQDNNFRLLIDKGTLKNPSNTDLERTSKELLKYFFIGLSLPNDKFWVNLRPDAADSIIDDKLAQTDIGRILLEADVQLKKDTAKATSPETAQGKLYWDKLYAKAAELFGSQNITIPTLTRPWIVPDEVIIRESTDSAYVYKASLKVILEQDYLKNSSTYNFKDQRLKQLNEYSSQLIRELIIPNLTKEINTSKQYAPLRQVYYSLILAQWFKARNQIKNNPYASLINSQNLAGFTSKTPYTKETYFNQYQKSFKDGEYNIHTPVTTPTGQVIRSYFSGGITGIALPTNEFELGKTIIGPNNESVTSMPVAIGQPLPSGNTGLIVMKTTTPGVYQFTRKNGPAFVTLKDEFDYDLKLKAINDAHQAETLREKAKFLKDGKFNASERRAIIENWIAGDKETTYDELIRQNKGAPMPLADDPLSATTLKDIFGEYNYETGLPSFLDEYFSSEDFKNSIFEESALGSRLFDAQGAVKKMLKHPFTDISRIKRNNYHVRNFAKLTPEKINQLREHLNQYYKYWDLCSFPIYFKFIKNKYNKDSPPVKDDVVVRNSKAGKSAIENFTELLYQVEAIDNILKDIFPENNVVLAKRMKIFLTKRVQENLITRADFIKLYSDLWQLAKNIGYLEFALGGLKMTKSAGYSWPQLSEKLGVIKLKGVWNPVAGDYKDLTKFDIDIGGSANFFVVTGANEAGKSTLLKTIALNVILAQMGLPVPSDSGAQISVFKNIYTLVPGAEDLEPGESRHTVLMKKLSALTKKVGPGDLVLIDEAHMGSDYKDLVALTSVLIEDLVATGATVIYATHLKETVSQLADILPNLKPKQIILEQSAEGLAKRRLEPGVAEHSLAIETLKRTGFPQEILDWMEEYYRAIVEGRDSRLPVIAEKDKGKELEFDMQVSMKLSKEIYAKEFEDNWDERHRGGGGYRDINGNLYKDQDDGEDDDEVVRAFEKARIDSKKSVAEKAFDILFPARNFYHNFKFNNLECSQQFIATLPSTEILKEWRNKLFGQEELAVVMKKQMKRIKFSNKPIEEIAKIYAEMMDGIKPKIAVLEEISRYTVDDIEAQENIKNVIKNFNDALDDKDQWFADNLGDLESRISRNPWDGNEILERCLNEIVFLVNGCYYSTLDNKDMLLFLDQNLGVAISMAENKLYFAQEGKMFSIKKARSPFIPDAIPVDLPEIAGNPQFIITGPNKSGKTAALMTLDVIVELVKKGLPVAAKVQLPENIFNERSRVVTFFGAEENMEKGESYFKSVAKQLLKLLYQAKQGDIIFMDELQGSDYWELSALQAAMIRYFDRLGATVFLNTHMREALIKAKDLKSVRFLKTDVTVTDQGEIIYHYSMSEDKNLESKSYGIETVRGLLTADQFKRALAIRAKMEGVNLPQDKFEEFVGPDNTYDIEKISRLADEMARLFRDEESLLKNEWNFDGSIKEKFGGVFLGQGSVGRVYQFGNIVMKFENQKEPFLIPDYNSFDSEVAALKLAKGNPLFQQYIISGNSDLDKVDYIVTEFISGDSFPSKYDAKGWDILSDEEKADHFLEIKKRLRSIPQEHWDQLVLIYKFAQEQSIAFDPVASNFKYDSQRGFVALDLTLRDRKSRIPFDKLLLLDAVVILAGAYRLQTGTENINFIEDQVKAAIQRVKGTAQTPTDKSGPKNGESSPSTLGGIDFRTLPIVTQAIGNLSINVNRSTIINLTKINLDQEWQDIEKLINSGIAPSTNRIKEYVQASCAQDKTKNCKDKVINGIADILRQEEDLCQRTNPKLLDILVVLQTLDNKAQLNQIFIGKN